eukprot:6174806-Pleurochrysis_carterae.AAC.1
MAEHKLHPFGMPGQSKTNTSARIKPSSVRNPSLDPRPKYDRRSRRINIADIKSIQKGSCRAVGQFRHLHVLVAPRHASSRHDTIDVLAEFRKTKEHFSRSGTKFPQLAALSCFLLCSQDKASRLAKLLLRLLAIAREVQIC